MNASPTKRKHHGNESKKPLLIASIHPRASGGGKKVNTSKKPSRSVLERKIAAVEAHIERTGDKTPHSHLSKLRERLKTLPAAA